MAPWSQLNNQYLRCNQMDLQNLKLFHCSFSRIIWHQAILGSPCLSSF